MRSRTGMAGVLWASLRLHRRRYVAASAAIVISVLFVVVSTGLASAVRNGNASVVGAPYAGAAAVAPFATPAEVRALAAAADAAGASIQVVGTAQVPVTAQGTWLDRSPTIGQVAASGPARWQDLTEGQWPARPGEALVDASVGRARGLEIGDVLTLGAERTRELRVVGFTATPRVVAAPDVWVLYPDLAPHLDTLDVQGVSWIGHDPGAAEAAIARAAPEVAPSTPQAWFVQLQQLANNGVDALRIVLLLFAGIAMFVSAVVIGNTFSILFTQRQRDLALLRCVGATRRQVLGSIRSEALVLGVASSLLGLVLGALAARGLAALLGVLMPRVAFGAPDLSWTWWAAAFTVGVVMTLAASWLPTRTAVRVRPLAALRPSDQHGTASPIGRIRLAAASVLFLVGVWLLLQAMSQGSMEALLLGGAINASGILLATPVIVPTGLRLAAPLLRRLGTPARLAAANALRNPRRSAATASALMIGVTLATAVLAGMGSVRDVTHAEQDVESPLDGALTVSTEHPNGLEGTDPGALLGQVDTLTRVPGAVVELSGQTAETKVLALAPADLSVWRGTAPDLSGPRILLGTSAAQAQLIETDPQGRLSLTWHGRTVTAPVTPVSGIGNAVVLSGDLWAELGRPTTTAAWWWRAGPEADADRISALADQTALTTQADFTDGFGDREWVDSQLTTVTAAVLGLLAVSVLIALTGIANALGLAVLERGRENSLLRALGLTRRALAGTLAWEAALLGAVAGMLGALVGLVYAAVGVQTAMAGFTDSAGLSIPWLQVVAVLGLSTLAGLAASLLPAHRSARTAPAEGLTLD